MDAHPDRPTLRAYGLGQLDGGAATAVARHMSDCPDCRRRIAGLLRQSPSPVSTTPDRPPSPRPAGPGRR